MSLVHVAGHPALDFLGTVSQRDSDPHEELSEPALLARWYVDAGLVTAPPAVDQDDLRRARELREHLHAVVAPWMEGRPAAEGARRAVNAAAAAGRPPAPVLEEDGRVSVLADADGCLAGLAASALLLMSSTEPGQVRWCGDRSCTHPFLDTSRAQRRRWCDMGTCGTRNKQREHRARRRGGVDAVG